MTATVPRLWPGSTVVCIASGPSLTPADVEAVRGKARVIAINRSVDLAPWADVLYCADAKMWRWLGGAPAFTGLKFGLEAKQGRFDVTKAGVTVLGRGSVLGLSTDPTRLCRGGHSGYQAVNLAYLLGASRIVLLGYDMQPGPRGAQHWHAEHPEPLPLQFQRWLESFAAIVTPLQACGVQIVNASRATALTCVPRGTLADALGSAVAA